MIHRFIKFLTTSPKRREDNFMGTKTKTTTKTKVKKVSTAKKNPAASGVKKGATKTVSVKKADKKKPLVVVSGDACFWVNNGALLSSMKDLGEALRTMSEDQFLHHTGMGRNDFSMWVLDVLGDKKCSADLSKAKNMKDALLAVEKHLKNYTD